MERRLLLLVAIGLSLFLLSGCARKRPKTAPQAPALHEETVAAPAAPVAAPAEEPAPAAPADPLSGDDLDAINQHVRAQGLLGDVFYAYDSSDLSDEARQRLADNARFLNRYPHLEALIEGHCDERGTPEYNLALGERRASAARSYLGSLGVDGSRLRTMSYGEERPVCTENEESCWQQNRRSHFVIMGRRNAG